MPVAAQESSDPPAEEAPEQEWGGFPGQEKPRPPPERRPVLPGETWNPGLAPPQYDVRPRPQPEPPPEPPQPNHISMLGAHPLGKWTRGQDVVVGFPLVELKVALGFTRWLDLSVHFNSMYGTLNEPGLGVRVTPLWGEHWALGLYLDAGAAFYSVRAPAEGYGPRWFTGRRNFNFRGGLKVSYQGWHPRSVRLFLDGYYLLAIDTEPFQRTPLDNTGRGVAFGHNAGLLLGTEMPLTSYTSLVFQIGAELHLRRGDSLVMPTAGIGLVTSI
jgi:hypothetical protein